MNDDLKNPKISKLEYQGDKYLKTLEEEVIGK